MPSLTPGSVRDLLAAHGCRPSRALGQHFLADPNLARKIVRLADVEPGDRVVEIGPGIGSLTVALAEAGAQVVALELDRHLLPVLDEVLADGGHGDDVTVVLGDALTVDFRALTGGGEWACVSNLPYNVATPMVMRLLEEFPEMSALPGDGAAGGRRADRGRAGHEGLRRGVGEGRATTRRPGWWARSRPPCSCRRPTWRRRWCGSTVAPAPPVEVPSPDALFAPRAGRVRAAPQDAAPGRCEPRSADRTEAVLAAAGIDSSSRAEALTLEDWARVCRAAA